jgi:predicted permease
MLRDVLYALRRVRTRPVLFTAAVLTIALGIAATTTVFSLLQTYLLRPLPYADPDRLVYVSDDRTARDIRDLPLSSPNFFDLRTGASSVFEELAALQTVDGVLPTADNGREPVHIAIVTPGILRVLGIGVQAGREFREQDAQVMPAEPAAGAAAPPQPLGVVVLSYEYWQRRYGGRLDVLERPVFPGGPQIVGILQPGVELLFPASFGVARTPELYLAGRLTYDAARRDVPRLRVIGRMRPGVTPVQAQAETDRVAMRLRHDFTNLNASGFQLRLLPMHAQLVASARPALLAMIGAAVFLLLIACINVANLLLVEASLRQRELAVRAALGARGRDLARLLMIEGALLALAGTLLGCGLTLAALDTVRALTPEKWPRLGAMRLDATLLIAMAATGFVSMLLLTGLLGWHASDLDAHEGLQARSATAGLGRGRRLRDLLVIGQVMLSFILLTGLGLMLRSFNALHAVQPGYDAAGVLTFQTIAQPPATPQEREAFMREIRDQLARIPGVTQVTASSALPLADVPAATRWGGEDALANPGAFRAADVQMVLPGYFEALRTPLRAGRTFSDDDNAPGRSIAIVDEWLAARAFGREPAVGRRVLVQLRGKPEWVEIVGVAAHQRTTSLMETGREQIYVTDGFVGHARASRWALRVSGDPANYAAPVRAALARMPRLTVVTEMTPMARLLERTQADQRFTLAALAAFAVVASLLAAVGLYGATATIVRQRAGEIGVRVALGASPAQIRQRFVRYGLRLGLIGLAGGVGAAALLTPLIGSLFFGVTPTDPVTFVAMALLCGLIVTAAAWLPARRAARLEPTMALREP